MGCAPPQLPVLAFASSCCDSKQASNRAARSAQRAGITGALPDELPMPMQSSMARTAAQRNAALVTTVLSIQEQHQHQEHNNSTNTMQSGVEPLSCSMLMAPHLLQDTGP